MTLNGTSAVTGNTPDDIVWASSERHAKRHSLNTSPYGAHTAGHTHAKDWPLVGGSRTNETDE
jgi:hypothetical protein